MKKSTHWIIVIGVMAIYLIVINTKIIESHRILFLEKHMEPGIKPNSKVFTTSLKTPKRNSIVAFKQKHRIKSGKYSDSTFEPIRVSRIIGVEHDKIEIKDGDVLINDIMIDENFRTQSIYKISKKNFKTYETQFNIRLYETIQMEGEWSYAIIEDKEAELLNNIIDIEIWDRCIKSDDEKSIAKESWTGNYFGPVTVPKESFFILNDNRDHYIDSRKFGFIRKEKVVGVKI